MRTRTAVVSAITAITAVLALCMFAAGATADPPVLVSGDDRATVHTGNVTGADCPALFPGSVEILKSDIVSSEDATYITVSTVDVKWYVLGFVVKGGDGYNLYPSSATSMSAIHPPVGPSGNPAEISHWFGCGLPPDEETTTETTTSDTTVETTTESTETTTTDATTTDVTTTDVTTTTDSTTSDTTTDATTTDSTTSETTSDTTTDATTTTSDSTSSVLTSDSSSAVVLTDSNSSSASVDPTDTEKEKLAYTGTSSVGWLLLAVLVLLGGGIAAVLFARRRKSKVS